jgi:hypothetical protein
MKIATGKRYIMFAVDSEDRIVADQEYDDIPKVGDILTFFADNFDGDYSDDLFEEVMAYRIIIALIEDDDADDDTADDADDSNDNEINK